MEVNDFLISIFDWKNRNFFLRRKGKENFIANQESYLQNSIYTNVVDKSDGASIVIFGVRSPSLSRPRLLPTGNFSRRSLCTSNSFGCTVHTGILPSDDISHGCCRQHRTSSSPRPERPPPQLSCFSSLPALFFFPIVVITALFFAHSCLHQIPFGTRFQSVVVTSPCQITRVILLSLFSFTLSLVSSATGRSSQRPVLRSCHSVCIKEIPRRYVS